MHLFQDDMYQPYEAPILKDLGKFDYATFEADGVNILSNGWQEKFELLAQNKLAKLREKNPEWQPFLVRRDHPFVYSGKPEAMKPLQFWFRLEKRG